MALLFLSRESEGLILGLAGQPSQTTHIYVQLLPKESSSWGGRRGPSFPQIIPKSIQRASWCGSTQRDYLGLSFLSEYKSVPILNELIIHIKKKGRKHTVKYYIGASGALTSLFKFT